MKVSERLMTRYECVKAWWIVTVHFCGVLVWLIFSVWVFVVVLGVCVCVIGDRFSLCRLG